LGARGDPDVVGTGARVQVRLLLDVNRARANGIAVRPFSLSTVLPGRAKDWAVSRYWMSAQALATFTAVPVATRNSIDLPPPEISL